MAPCQSTIPPKSQSGSDLEMPFNNALGLDVGAGMPTVNALGMPYDTESLNNNYSETTTEGYSLQADYKGAMSFTVCVVCVYGLAIVAFIAGHLKKRQVKTRETR